MDLQLTNRTVLISGGASGIGEAIVRQFAAEGARVVFVDKDVEKSAAVQESVSESGGACAFLEADLTDEHAIWKIVDRVHADHGGVNVLVNNAGLNDGAGLDSSTEAFQLSLQRNLYHYDVLKRLCQPSLTARRGTIINIGSKASITGQGGSSGYVASKGAINALTGAWAKELARKYVRVYGIVPAEVRTPQYESWLETLEDGEFVRKSITSLIPLGHRMTEPTEIADTATFLASPLHSIASGQLVFVDGGYTHLDKANITLKD